jgi:hypothetical protein
MRGWLEGKGNCPPERATAEEAERQRQIKQGEQDELNQAAGAAPGEH